MKTTNALFAAAVVMLAACGGGGDPASALNSNGSIRGTVTDNTGATVANAAVALTGNGQAARTTNSGADGVYTFANVPAGTYTLAVTPPAGFTIGAAGTASVTVASGAQANASAFVLNRVPADPGEWGLRAGLLAANSEFALAEANGKLYVLGGYPAFAADGRARCRSTTSRATAGSSDRSSRSPTTTGWRPPSTERST